MAVRYGPSDHARHRDCAMRRALPKMLAEFRRYWPNYLLQSALATLVVFILMLLLRMEEMVITASLGSTAFIVFAMPKALTAQARNVVGGHMVGLGCGLLCALLPAAGFAAQMLLASCAVGLSIFIMVVTDTEHPPASGTALGTAMGGFAYQPVIAVIIGAVLLALVHRLAHRRMRDLA